MSNTVRVVLINTDGTVLFDLVGADAERPVPPDAPTTIVAHVNPMPSGPGRSSTVQRSGKPPPFR